MLFFMFEKTVPLCLFRMYAFSLTKLLSHYDLIEFHSRIIGSLTLMLISTDVLFTKKIISELKNMLLFHYDLIDQMVQSNPRTFL